MVNYNEKLNKLQHLVELQRTLVPRDIVYLRDDFRVEYFKLRDELLQDRDELIIAEEALVSIDNKFNLKDNVFEEYFNLMDELHRHQEEINKADDTLHGILNKFIGNNIE